MATNITIAVCFAIIGICFSFRVLPTMIRLLAVRLSAVRQKEGVVELINETAVSGGI